MQIMYSPIRTFGFNMQLTFVKAIVEALHSFSSGRPLWGKDNTRLKPSRTEIDNLAILLIDRSINHNGAGKCVNCFVNLKRWIDA